VSEPAVARFVVVSACSYIGAPPDAYRPYLDGRYRDEFQKWVSSAASGRLPNHMIGTAPLYDPGHVEKVLEKGRTRMGVASDPGARLDELNAQGVAAEVLFPDFRLGAQPPFNPLHGPLGGYDERRLAGARAYNRWLAEFCASQPSRLAGIAVILPDDIDEAVADIERAKAAGLRGVVLPRISGPPPTGALPRLGAADPAWEPIWAACESLDLPVHTLGGTGMPDYGSLPGSALLYSFDWPVSANSGLMFMVLGGVLEAHPHLRMVLADQGSRRIADMLNEWDKRDRSWRFNASYYAGVRPPWHYWMRQCFVTPSPMRRHDSDLRDVLGVSQMMWSSRFPQPVGAWLDVGAEVREVFRGVPERHTRLILGENAMRAYSLDGDALRAVAGRIGIEPGVTVAA
jgi:predicted TIM-barrel fold metal-dependent hydrolase